MEDVCNIQQGDHVALFNDNAPTVAWAQRLAAKSALVAGQLIRALALQLKAMKASPLSTLHIAGVENSITDIPSRSFGTPSKWYCATDEDLLTLYDPLFPLDQMDGLPSFARHFYAAAFNSADKAFNLGRVASTAKARQTHWKRWKYFVTPLGIEPDSDPAFSPQALPFSLVIPQQIDWFGCHQTQVTTK